MVWNVEGDLDENITFLRNVYESVTGKSITKKDFIKKLIYEHVNLKTLLETNGLKIDKEVLKMPTIKQGTKIHTISNK